MPGIAKRGRIREHNTLHVAETSRGQTFIIFNHNTPLQLHPTANYQIVLTR